VRIGDAKQLYANQLNTLWERKKTLTQLLQEQPEGTNYDRVELSQELTQVEEQYEQAQSVMEKILTRETALHDAEVTKQQSKAAIEGAKEIQKCLEIARRISSGATVPSFDEKKLMEFNYELYMAAKNMAFLRGRQDKEYDSLWKDKDRAAKAERSPSEVASNGQIDVPAPSAPEAPPSIESMESAVVG